MKPLSDRCRISNMGTVWMPKRNNWENAYETLSPVFDIGRSKLSNGYQSLLLRGLRGFSEMMCKKQLAVPGT